MTERLKLLWQWRHLLGNLVWRDLRLRYRRSLLGPFWLLINPLILVGLYTFVFSVVLSVPIKKYPLFLLSGLIPWLWFASTMATSVSALSRDSNLLRKGPFPSELLVLRAIVVTGLDFMVGLLLLFLRFLAYGGQASVSLLLLPLLLLLQGLLIAGVAMPLAMAGAVSHDFDHLVGSGLRILFFLTPVAYSIESVPQTYRPLLALNPLSWLTHLYQQVILGNSANLHSLLLLALLSVCTFLFGWSFYRRRACLLPEVL